MSKPESMTAAPSPALQIDNLTVGYGRTKVISELSMTVARGSVTALLGANGAGKTTLLRAVTGLIPVRAGSVRLHGTDVTQLPLHKRSRLGLCHVPEGRGIYRTMSVRENLCMQSPRGAEDESIDRAVSAFPVLGKRLSQAARTLSGGEQQMLAMAAAYVRNPSVIVVDELSLGLAPVVVDRLYDFLRKLVEDGSVTLLLIDQYAGRALDLADTTYVLGRGEIVFEGNADDLAVDELFDKYMAST